MPDQGQTKNGDGAGGTPPSDQQQDDKNLQQTVENASLDETKNDQVDISEVQKKEENNPPPKPDINIKSESNTLPGIGDLTQYIQQKKQEQISKTGSGDLHASDGTDLKSLPGIYAIVPHHRGDHKLVYFEKDAPSDLVDDPKKRTTGTVYKKAGSKIYDVCVDFKQHPTLTNKENEAFTVWLIEEKKQVDEQIHAIRKGKGGGGNFGEPVIVNPDLATRKQEDEEVHIEQRSVADMFAGISHDSEENENDDNDIKETKQSEPEKKGEISEKEKNEQEKKDNPKGTTKDEKQVSQLDAPEDSAPSIEPKTDETPKTEEVSKKDPEHIENVAPKATEVKAQENEPTEKVESDTKKKNDNEKNDIKAATSQAQEKKEEEISDTASKTAKEESTTDQKIGQKSVSSEKTTNKENTKDKHLEKETNKENGKKETETEINQKDKTDTSPSSNEKDTSSKLDLPAEEIEKKNKETPTKEIKTVQEEKEAKENKQSETSSDDKIKETSSEKTITEEKIKEHEEIVVDIPEIRPSVSTKEEKIQPEDKVQSQQESPKDASGGLQPKEISKENPEEKKKTTFTATVEPQVDSLKIKETETTKSTQKSNDNIIEKPKTDDIPTKGEVKNDKAEIELGSSKPFPKIDIGALSPKIPTIDKEKILPKDSSTKVEPTQDTSKDTSPDKKEEEKKPKPPTPFGGAEESSPKPEKPIASIDVDAIKSGVVKNNVSPTSPLKPEEKKETAPQTNTPQEKKPLPDIVSPSKLASLAKDPQTTPTDSLPKENKEPPKDGSGPERKTTFSPFTDPAPKKSDAPKFSLDEQDVKVKNSNPPSSFQQTNPKAEKKASEQEKKIISKPIIQETAPMQPNSQPEKKSPDTGGMDLDSLDMSPPTSKAVQKSNVGSPNPQTTQKFVHSEKSTKNKKSSNKKTLGIVFRIVGLFVFFIISFLVWRMMFSNTPTQPTPTPDDTPVEVGSGTQEVPDDTENPDEIPDDTENPDPTPDPVPDTSEVPTYTITELKAKFKAQELEARRLLNTAKLLENKNAIKFSTAALLKAAKSLEKAEKDSTITASELEADAERIDVYIEQASSLIE